MLGKRIAFMRRRLGMSQEVLADKIGVTPGALGAYEQGRRSPSVGVLVALSRSLGVSLEFLLTGQPTGSEELSDAVQYVLQARMGEGAESRTAMAVQMLLLLTEHQKR